MKKIAFLLFVIAIFTNATAQQHTKEVLPVKIQGNWLQPQNNIWAYGFYTQMAMVDGHFWNYKHIEQRNNKIILQLEKGAAQKLITVKVLSDSSFKIKNSGKNWEVVTNKWNNDPDYSSDHSPAFQRPFIKKILFIYRG